MLFYDAYDPRRVSIRGGKLLIEPYRGWPKLHEKWSLRRLCDHCDQKLFPPREQPVSITLKQNIVLVSCSKCGRDNEITTDPNHLNRELRQLVKSGRSIAIKLRLGEDYALHFKIGWPSDESIAYFTPSELYDDDDLMLSL